jgi:hypothetical protein
MINSKTLIVGLTVAALLGAASTAFAQSTVTGTLSSGGSNTTTTSSNTVTGTVASTSSTSGNTTGTTGTAGGGSGSNIIDICPNLSGTQNTLPAGYVISGGNCVQNAGVTNTGTTGTGTGTVTSGATGTGSAVLGTSTSNPSVPNTGAGGTFATTLAVLAASAVAIFGGTRLLKGRNV